MLSSDLEKILIEEGRRHLPSILTPELEQLKGNSSGNEDVPIAIGKEHTSSSAEDKKINYLCTYCRFPLVKLSSEEYFCNRDHVSFFPNEENMRVANKVSMPRTAEENPPLVSTKVPDPTEEFLNKGKVEPQGGLKALSESSKTIKITSYEEKDGAGRTIKKEYVVMNKMRVPLQRVHTCAYCSGKVHIIDPRSYPNDVMAVKDKLGWKCGDCIENEIKDRIIRVIPNSDRAKEIIAERERESKKRRAVSFV